MFPDFSSFLRPERTLITYGDMSALTGDSDVDEVSVRLADDHHVDVADVATAVFQGGVADQQVIALLARHRPVLHVVLVV